MKKALSFEDFQALAIQHYNNGGDAIVECWDEQTYDDYVEEFGYITEETALKIFRTNKALEKEYENI
jgi:hypothetical protein